MEYNSVRIFLNENQNVWLGLINNGSDTGLVRKWGWAIIKTKDSQYTPYNMPLGLMCFVLLDMYYQIVVDSWHPFTHILPGCFINTGAINHVIAPVPMK